jgi:hypothetical protein
MFKGVPRRFRRQLLKTGSDLGQLSFKQRNLGQGPFTVTVRMLHKRWIKFRIEVTSNRVAEATEVAVGANFALGNFVGVFVTTELPSENV